MTHHIRRTPFPLLATLLLAFVFGRPIFGRQAADVPCDSIAMEYDFLGGGGGPPVAIRSEPAGHKVMLNKVGQSELHRNGHYPLYGVTVSGTDFVGTVPPADFAELCRSAKQPAFEALASSYGGPGGPDGIRLTFIVTSGATRKYIGEINNRGPAELRSFQRAIQAVAQKVQWGPKQ